MKIKLIAIGLMFWSVACKPNKETQFNRPGLKTYEYLFAIHFSSHDCMSCLYHITGLDSMQKVLDANGANTLVAVAGDSSSDFMEMYRYFEIDAPVIPEDKMKAFPFFREKATPVFYFINLRTRHCIAMDKLPEEEYRFNALRDWVYAWSGVINGGK